MKTWMMGLLLVLAGTWQAVGQEVGTPIGPDALAASTSKLLEIWNEGKVKLIPEVYAADYVRHDVTAPQAVTGVAGIEAVVKSNREAFPDLKLTIDEQVQAGARVMTRWTLTGTNTGPVQSMAPTGKKIRVHGVTLTSYDEDGKIADQWVYWNAMSLLGQLGFKVVPPGEK